MTFRVSADWLILAYCVKGLGKCDFVKTRNCAASSGTLTLALEECTSPACVKLLLVRAVKENPGM